MQSRNVIPPNRLTSFVITGISKLSITDGITKAAETNLSKQQGKVSAEEPHKRSVARSQSRNEPSIICQNLCRDLTFFKIIYKNDQAIEGVIEIVRRNGVKLLLRKTRHDMNNWSQPVIPFAFSPCPRKFQRN